MIGKSKLAKIGYKCAIAVGFSEADARKFTGHWLRRSAITFAAEHGLSLAQIKTMSGHKSDTVVQGYIDKSDVMKRTCADASQLDEKILPTLTDNHVRKKVVQNGSPEPQQIHYHFHFEKATINAPIHFNGSSTDFSNNPPMKEQM